MDLATASRPSRTHPSNLVTWGVLLPLACTTLGGCEKTGSAFNSGNDSSSSLKLVVNDPQRIKMLKIQLRSMPIFLEQSSDDLAIQYKKIQKMSEEFRSICDTVKKFFGLLRENAHSADLQRIADLENAEFKRMSSVAILLDDLATQHSTLLAELNSALLDLRLSETNLKEALICGRAITAEELDNYEKKVEGAIALISRIDSFPDVVRSVIVSTEDFLNHFRSVVNAADAGKI